MDTKNEVLEYLKKQIIDKKEHVDWMREEGHTEGWDADIIENYKGEIRTLLNAIELLTTK